MPSVGECIGGRYRLDSPLDEGGMGSVWEARHLALDAPVAIKFQHAHRASGQRAAARFQREARAAAKLAHPNVVRVVDYGIDVDVPFIAMELLEGESLKARLERLAVLAPEDAVEFTRQAASALDAAHGAGIVHRDLKPSNLFVVKDGEGESVKLLDFGIAKWFEGDGEGVTEDDLVVGSAQYMSPEQARGEAVDGRADVWSLGVVAYQMLVGELPFQGANIPDTLSRICAGKYDPPSFYLGDRCAAVDPVFARAFELDAELRFESGGAFASALREAACGLTPEARHTDNVNPSSGWAFGRERETLSIQMPRTRVARRASRSALPIALSAGALALAFFAGRGAPPAGSPTPSSLHTTSAPAAAAVTLPSAGRAPLVADAVAPSSSAVRSQRNGPLHSRRHAPEKRQLPAPLAEPAPSAPSYAAPPTHVDPVFGLEVPAPR